jgi:DNA-binding transcriptional regulator YiaG
MAAVMKRARKRLAPDLNFTPERIAAIRDRLGMTQEQLAAEIGVDQATVSMWLSGRRTPSGAGSLQRLLELESRKLKAGSR